MLGEPRSIRRTPGALLGDCVMEYAGGLGLRAGPGRGRHRRRDSPGPAADGAAADGPGSVGRAVRVGGADLGHRLRRVGLGGADLRGEAAAGETVFTPLPEAVLSINQRLKQSFDPSGIFNPGRLYPNL